MFWIVLFMFLNHLRIPHTPNPLFSSNFLLFFPKKILNSFKPYTVSCIAHSDNSVHPFYPSLSSTLFTFPTILHLEYCATLFILLFQQRNAHNYTSFFNSSKVPDSNLFFIFLLIHLRITYWIEHTFPLFFSTYTRLHITLITLLAIVTITNSHSLRVTKSYITIQRESLPLICCNPPICYYVFIVLVL